MPAQPIACATGGTSSDTIRTHASEHSPPTAGAPPSQGTIPGQTYGGTTGATIHPKTDHTHTRPETHQNLIHSNKEQTRTCRRNASATGFEG